MTGLYFAVFHGDLIIAETGIPAFAVTIYYPIVFIFGILSRGKPVMLWTWGLRVLTIAPMHTKDTC